MAYLSSHGNYRGRFQPAWAKDASVRQQQYRRSLDETFCLHMAQAIVTGKIRNAVVFCRRQRRLTRQGKQCTVAMEALLPKVHSAMSLEQLMGYEGSAAALYYRVLRTFLQTDLGFQSRQAHPPTDPVNALLSLGYTLLYNQMLAAINIVGLDPYQGFFHQRKHGHAALASDLIEEWRAIIVDSIVLTVINRREIKPDDFHRAEQGLRLTKAALTRFVSRYDARVRTPVFVPAIQGKTPYQRVFELQARQLGRVLSEEHVTYQPFQIQ